MAAALCPAAEAQAYTAVLDADCQDVEALLQAVRLARSASPATSDLIVGFGELWSTRLFARMLIARSRRPAVRWVDARDMVEVEWGHLGPAVRWEASRAKALRIVGAETATTLIVPGFIARDPQGIQTTLGRNGSDFSASILGDLLNASEIHIWTDVDGVLSADPRRVPDARVIDALS
jgi:aspartokinase/homoserine dehydrogenase 1